MANTPYFDSFWATVGNAVIILTPAQIVFLAGKSDVKMSDSGGSASSKISCGSLCK